MKENEKVSRPLSKKQEKAINLMFGRGVIFIKFKQ